MDSETIDLVLIDDDSLIRKIWEMQAKKKNLTIKTFEGFESFLDQNDSIPIFTPIFIDYSLEGNTNGADASEKIHLLGYDQIYITTGYDPSDIQYPKFIVKVIGKEFPEGLL